MRILTAAVLAASSQAVGQIDRIIDTPTAWAYLYGASSTAINDQLAAGYRPFCVERTALNQYDTVFVRNTGSYAVSGTQVLYGATAASVGTWLSSNNLRLLELEPYENNGNLFMAAVAVPNSGATATPGWGWVYNVTFNQVAAWLTANPTLRLLDLDVYTVGGTQYYSAVAIPNTGANAQSWWWYGGVTATQITQALTTNGARLIAIELVDAGNLITPATFACVMVGQNPGGGWWHHSLTTDQVAALADSVSGRISCLKRYTNFQGQTRWAVALIDNGNAQTRRMRSYIWNANSGGSTGFMLKEVGGPVLAANNVNFVWEPCSTVKLLHAIYAIRRCSLNQDNLNNNVLYKNLCASCPFTWTCVDTFRSLTTALQDMLRPSDNYALIALERRYGVPTLNSFADSNGFGNIQIDRQTCDCGVVLNTATCTDMSAMLEQAADGTLFDQGWQDNLIFQMNNLTRLGYGTYPTLDDVIAQEAAPTDLTAAEITAFRDAMEFANKGGNYGCGNGIYWRTEGGFAIIPFKADAGPLGWVTYTKEYVYSLFAHNATDDVAARIVHSGKEEIIREQIREALQSWDAACNTPSINNQPDPITRSPGQTANFSVGVVTNPAALAYRWRRNGVNLNNGATGNGSTISGATSANLTITSVASGDGGIYSCVVTTPCGQATSAAALLTISAACYANCDGSTVAPVLNVNDFICFQTKFAQNDPYANCDGSTTAPVLNVNDFICFQTRFAQGCP